MNTLTKNPEARSQNPEARKLAPMTDARIEAIYARHRALPLYDQMAVLWQTIGGAQLRAVEQPNAHIREFFDVMERRIGETEAKHAGLLNQAQLDGCACVSCGAGHRAMIPLGIETRSSSELFVCDRSECTVDPDAIRNRIPAAARVAA